MCGILALLGSSAGAVTPEQRDECISTLKPRGPERSSFYECEGAVLGFTRLAINGVENGHQPITGDGTALVCNGEIYNCAELAVALGIALPAGASDCGVLPGVFAKLPPHDACRALDGVFALVYVDASTETAIVARDPYGVRPLFFGRGRGVVAFASEAKALLPLLGAEGAAASSLETVEAFPPGTWWRVSLHTGETLEAARYHETPWVKVPLLADPAAAKDALRVALVAAVEKRLHLAERPVGALLSGGLDSSLVCAIAARALKREGRSRLRTFSVGMPGSTDLAFAAAVARHIGSEHTEVLLTPAQFCSAVDAVVSAAETYDVTTVRASVGNYLVAGHVAANTDIKVLLNGDGSDEAAGGYLYFGRAPSDAAFEAEVARLLADIHRFDVLRSDRSVAAHGLEARTPFLDKQLVATWLGVSTALRRPTAAQPEKYILRAAFDDAADPWLPASVLWRRKEAFSDGVSAAETPWHATLDAWAKARLSAPEFAADAPPLDPAAAAARWPHNPPRTAEATLYRLLFERRFGRSAPVAALIPYFWMPRWSPETADPSARTLALYAAAPEVAAAGGTVSEAAA